MYNKEEQVIIGRIFAKHANKLIGDVVTEQFNKDNVTVISIIENNVVNIRIVKRVNETRGYLFLQFKDLNIDERVDLGTGKHLITNNVLTKIRNVFRDKCSPNEVTSSIKKLVSLYNDLALSNCKVKHSFLDRLFNNRKEHVVGKDNLIDWHFTTRKFILFRWEYNHMFTINLNKIFNFKVLTNNQELFKGFNEFDKLYYSIDITLTPKPIENYNELLTDVYQKLLIKNNLVK